MDYVDAIRREAERVFEDKARAAVWLTQRRTAFGDRSALELARDRAGYQQVLEIICCLEHSFGS